MKDFLDADNFRQMIEKVEISPSLCEGINSIESRDIDVTLSDYTIAKLEPSDKEVVKR